MDKIIIKKVNSVEECINCNRLLEELIKFESKLDDNINSGHQVHDFYERTLNRDDSVIFLALCNDEPIGYIMAYKQKHDDSRNNKSITIMSLYIKEEFRNMNIGRSLMTELEKWAKSLFDKFIIEVDCIFNNTNALSFYKKLGYDPVRIKLRKNVTKD